MPTNDDEENKEDEKLILILKETTNTKFNKKQDRKENKHSFDGVFVHKVKKQPAIETTSKEEDPLKTIYLLDKGMFTLLMCFFTRSLLRVARTNATFKKSVLDRFSLVA